MNPRKTAQKIADAAIAAGSKDRDSFVRLRDIARKEGVESYPVRDRSGDQYSLARVLDIEQARRS